MLKTLSALILVFQFAAYATAAPRVVTLTTGEWPPFFSESLPGGGIMTRLITEAFRLEDIRVQYTYMPWVRSYEAAKTRKFDGTIGLAPNPERLKWFAFSEPVITADMVFFHHKGLSVRWNTLADLAPYMIGATRGDYYSDEFAALQKAGKLKVDDSGTDEIANFRKLVRGRITLFPIERHVGQYLLNLNFLPQERAQLTYTNKTFWAAPLHILINKQKPDGPVLLKIFNRGLAKLKSSGAYQRIVNEGMAVTPIPDAH